jgi:hypothetical protein
LDELAASSSSIDEAYERLKRWKKRAIADLQPISPTEARDLERKRNAYAITDSFEPFEKEITILRAFLEGVREEIISNGVTNMPSRERDIAQICVAGHRTNSRVRDIPDLNKAFCDLCGSKTITACPKCSGQIPGGFPGITSAGSDPAPKFCVHCGCPYPWTQLALQTALELSDEAADLSSEQREQLKSSIRDLVQESPKTQLAVIRFKKLIGSAGGAIGDAVKKTLAEVLSEVIKRQIWG